MPPIFNLRSLRVSLIFSNKLLSLCRNGIALMDIPGGVSVEAFLKLRQSMLLPLPPFPKMWQAKCLIFTSRSVITSVNILQKSVTCAPFSANTCCRQVPVFILKSFPNCGSKQCPEETTKQAWKWMASWRPIDTYLGQTFHR